MDSGTITNLVTGALSGGLLIKVLDVLAARRSVATNADVTRSADQRAWVETFRSEIATMQVRHHEEIASLSARHRADVDDMRARIDLMEGSIADKDKRIAALERENTDLEATVSRLQARVLELERGSTFPAQ